MMDLLKLYAKQIAVILLLSLVLAIAFAAYLFGVKTATPALEIMSEEPQVVQADGSVIAARTPQSAPSAAPHLIPKKDTEERRVNLKLKPPAFVSEEGCQCEPAPVGIHLSLVREGSGRRVIASSDTGTVLSAVDIPIESALMPPAPHPWAAGISYDPLQKSPGIWLERDLGRIRLGAEVLREQQGSVLGRLRLGWVF